MENPASWTPLHHQLSTLIAEGADPVRLASLLHASVQDVSDLLAKHQADTERGVCGLSLESTLVNKPSK